MTPREQYAAMGYLLLEEYEAHLQASNRSSGTIRSRLRILERLNEHLTLGLVFARTAEIEAFLSALHRKGRGRWTISSYYNHIRQFFGWADTAGKLDGDPTLLMRKPKPGRFAPKPLVREEVELAFTSPEPYLTMFALAYYEGLRAKEIAACSREDFTEEHTYIHGKGGDPEVVITHPAVWELIRDRPPGRLFATGERGGHVDAHWVSQGARRQFTRLGLKGRHIHQLRHSYATEQLVAGVDIRTVQENLRHKSVNTTAAYTQVTAERRRAAVLSLPVVGTPAGSKPAGVARGRPGGISRA